MTTDRHKQPKLPPTVALECAVAEFKRWLGAELQKGKSVTHEVRVSIDERGRVQLKFRPPWKPLSD